MLHFKSILPGFFCEGSKHCLKLIQIALNNSFKTFWEVDGNENTYLLGIRAGARGGGGHFNFICTGVCGHRIGKLTHPQTKAGTKTDPFSDYLQQKLTKLQQVSFNLEENHSFPSKIISKSWPIHRFLVKNLHPSAGFRPGKLTHSGRTSLIWPNMGVPPMEKEVVRGEPPPENFRKRQITPKIKYRRKRNLSEIPIHFRYWKKNLVSQLYEWFSRNVRNLGHFWKFEKISNF